MAETYDKIHQFYDGFELLMPFSELIGVPIDQINFFFSHLVAITLGGVFRILVPPSSTGPFVRHLIEIFVGISLLYFCFGRQIIHMLAQSLVAYLLMITLKVGLMEKAVILYVVGYLSSCHMYRMMFDYGGYTLDITGPLMINTQKITSLAFNVRDGNVDQSNMPAALKVQSVKGPPKLYEFLSYVFCFHSIMCGPFCFYKDYMDFIDGSHFKNTQYPDRIPSPLFALVQKLTVATFFGLITVYVAPNWPCIMLTGPQFAEETFFRKNFLLVFVSCLHRYKYYFAWSLGEASNINAGLGFNGYDDKGAAKWDLIDNATITKTELAVNMKQFIENWNKSTNVWLRYMVYERTHNTMLVFVFSAIWHGFYPGYFGTFLSAGMFILAARKLRRLLRHHFQASRGLSVTYDVITFLVTSVSMCYVGFPFMVLLAQPTLHIYWHLYFYQHVAAATILVAFAIHKAWRSPAIRPHED